MTSSAEKYYGFCEILFVEWLKGDDYLNVFRNYFNIDYLPEPYLVFKEGKRKLFVLNNNPGHILENQVQARHTIKAQYPGMSYAEVAKGMTTYYLSEDFLKNEHNASRRNQQMLQFANEIGCDGLENVETFFLHRGAMSKKIFLNKFSDNQIVLEYTQCLKNYLADKDVLVISNLGGPINKETIKKTDWVKYQCDIIGLDIDKAELIQIKEKAGRFTTGIMGKSGKFISFMWGGSNNLPDIPKESYDKIRRLSCRNGI